MKLKLIGIALWLSMTSFVPDTTNERRARPLHSSPVMEVFLSENEHKELLVAIKAEKLFLKNQGLTDEQFKIEVAALKNYMHKHFKIYMNKEVQHLRLKSISESRLRVNLHFKITPSSEFDSLKVFSDCLVNMEYHDRMPIRVNMRNTLKTYQLNKNRTSIQINQL